VADHDGFACSDEDQCTIGEGCSAGECIGGVALNCADNNVCTDDSCAPATGCSNTANSASCDDLSACTTGDQCALGSCVGGAQIACDDGNLCTDDACDASSGCTTTANQAACDDGNTCTTGDGCSGGWCLGTDALACDDGNACTVDACDPALGCTATPSGSACDDGDACTVGETCSLTGCTGGADVVCDDASACTTDSCDPISGCVAIPVDGDCDDLNACTTADSCLAGECVGGVPLVCDDANDCTTDSCDPAEGCVAAPGASSCDDGNPCTVDDYCVLAVCFSGTIAGCNDGNVCTDDGCEAGSGCTFTPNDGACDDDNECTVGDACVGVWCLSTGPAECDDGVACTADVCTPGVGCGHHPDDPSCDDGDACTTSSCDMTGGCTSGPVPDCNDLEICTTDSCDPAAGCVNEPNLLDCEDGAVCTDNDSCAGGVCVGGAAPTCDDEDPCTTDECVDGTGCVHTPIAPCCGNLIEEGGETCDDGNQSPNDGCSPQCQVELGNCSNGSSTDCNVVGTTLIPSSAFVDPNPPAGWEQCAGFINTGGDDVANAFLNNCLNSNRLRIRVWNGNTLEEDVLSSNIASHTVWPAWNYLGGGMTKLVSTFWTGGTTFFSTTNGSDACSTGCCTSAPNGTLTLGTGNGSSAIVAPGNTDASEWRVNCSGQSLPGRKLAFYR
jgi:cysteine-rich repeat protein